MKPAFRCRCTANTREVRVENGGIFAFAGNAMLELGLLQRNVKGS